MNERAAATVYVSFESDFEISSSMQELQLEGELLEYEVLNSMPCRSSTVTSELSFADHWFLNFSRWAIV